MCGPLSVTGLDAVMARGVGDPGLLVAMLDGPVLVDHPGLAASSLITLSGQAATCASTGVGCGHGTAVAGVLVAGRDTPARGICPGVRLLVRPIFTEHSPAWVEPVVVARAIVDCVEAGARIVNVSAAFIGVIPTRDQMLGQALDHAAGHGVIVVAAAGNNGRVGGSPLLSHRWVIPVSSTDEGGYPSASTNLGGSIGRNGVSAPGVGITSLTPDGGYGPFGGTSAAAALVCGAIALAWSAAPATPAQQVRAAITSGPGRRGVIPPLLDALRLYQYVIGQQGGIDDRARQRPA